MPPAGKFEGGSKTTGRTRFIGIVWNSRVMGEISARPSVCMPPLQLMEVHRLLEDVRSRHDRHHTTKALRPYGIYINLSGGREFGTQYQRWFQTTGPPTPVARSVHV